jgi:4-amino-4-deoxy-L-arabinose transferase-like glycosyltransferase
LTLSSGRPRALFLGSIAAALLGQSFLTGSPLPLLSPGAGTSGTGLKAGTLLLGLAVLLSALGTPPPDPAEERRGPLRIPSPRTAAVGIAVSLAAAFLYGVFGESAAVRLLWPAGIALFVFAFWPDAGSPVDRVSGPSLWRDAAFLFAIVVGGFALRYVRLTDWPAELDGDLASAGLQVMALGGDSRWIGVGESNLPLVFYRLLQAGTGFFGLNLHGLMAQSVLIGTLAIGAAYLLGREVGGRHVGLLAAALLAASYTAIHFSRLILTPSAMLAVTLTLVFLLRGLKTGGGRWFALAGAMSGAASLLCFGGRMALLIATVVFLFDVATAGESRRPRLRGWATMAVAALLTAGPMLVFYARVPRALVARGLDVTIFAERNRAHLFGKYGVTTVGEMLLEQVRRTFLTFHLYGDSSSQFGFPGPMVDMLTAAFLLAGLGLTLRRLRSPASRGLLAWLGGVLVVGGVLTPDPPDWASLVVALPAVVVLAALGMGRLLTLWREPLGRAARAVVPGLLVVVFAGTAFDNWQRYRRAVEDNAGPQCAIARWIDGLEKGTRVLLVCDSLTWEDRKFQFLNRGVEGRDATEEEIRGLEEIGGSTAIILTRDYAERLLPVLARRFPKAEVSSHSSHGWLQFYSVRIRASRVSAVPAYDSLGKTSRLGWAAGLLLAALAASAPFWFGRGLSGSVVPSAKPLETAALSPPEVEPPRKSPGPSCPVSEPVETDVSRPHCAVAPSLEEEEVQRPLLLVFGLCLAGAAQVLLGVGYPDGLPAAERVLRGLGLPVLRDVALVLLVVASGAWWLAMGRRPLRIPSFAVRARRSPAEIAGLFLPALAFGAFGVFRFVRSGEDPWVRLAWAASLLALFSSFSFDAVHRRGERAERESSPPFRLAHILLLLTVLAVAGWLRFHELGVLPDDFHGDMASYGLTAREYLLGGETRIFGIAWADIPRLGYMPTVLAMRVFGNDIRGLMAAAAVGGMLFLIALYALVWRLFDSHRLAILSVAIAAGNTAHIHFSRIAAYMDPWPFCLGAFLFAVDGLRARRPLSFAASGILLGVGVQMYYSGRVAVFVLGALLLQTLLFERDRLRGSAVGLAALGAGFLLALGPNIAFFLENSHVINARGRDIWLFTPAVQTHLSGVYRTSNPVEILFVQIRRTLLTFNQTIDTSTQFGYAHAMFVPLLAPLVLLGLVLILRRWRERGPALMIALWAFTLALGGFLTVDAPFWPRLVGVLAPASLFAALALDTLVSAVAVAFRPAVRRWLWIPVAALLVVAATLSWRTYRRDETRNARAQALIGRFLERVPADVSACGIVDPFWLEVRETAFLAWPRHLVDLKPEEAAAPPAPCSTPPFVWILSKNHIGALHDLEARWPDGVVEDHLTKGGDSVFVSFRVPAGAGAPP